MSGLIGLVIKTVTAPVVIATAVVEAVRYKGGKSTGEDSKSTADN